jgi:hypothetical protein
MIYFGMLKLWYMLQGSNLNEEKGLAGGYYRID